MPTIAKSFFIKKIVLVMVSWVASATVDLHVNPEQVQHPEKPKVEHPIVQISDNRTIHNPENEGSDNI